MFILWLPSDRTSLCERLPFVISVEQFLSGSMGGCFPPPLPPPFPVLCAGFGSATIGFNSCPYPKAVSEWMTQCNEQIQFWKELENFKPAPTCLGSILFRIHPLLFLISLLFKLLDGCISEYFPIIRIHPHLSLPPLSLSVTRREQFENREYIPLSFFCSAL